MRRASLKLFLATLLIVVIGAAAAPLVAHAAIGKPHVAALQAALWERGHYRGAVDGLTGPLTRAAVEDFQRESGMQPTGKAGTSTVAALGGPARRLQAGTVARSGDTGWDVVRLQFLLAWRGFPSGEFDGVFGERVERATMRFQEWAGMQPDGVAGQATFAALRRPPARPHVRLSTPVSAPVGDVFGPRENRFHAGIDMPAATGTPVGAVKAGTVVYAAYDEGGFGNTVVVRHRYGLTTRYAHLSEFAVAEGDQVRRGDTVGMVGSTGHSTGPHLHLEVTFRGALIDPTPLLSG